MLPVHEVLNLREGNLIAGYLAGQGIPAEVRGGAFQSADGELGNIRGSLPRIFVLEDGDAPRARASIAAYLGLLKERAPGDPWTCPGCGEILEPQFQSCWKCQADNPG